MGFGWLTRILLKVVFFCSIVKWSVCVYTYTHTYTHTYLHIYVCIHLYRYMNPSIRKMRGCWEVLMILCVCVCFILFLEDPSHNLLIFFLFKFTTLKGTVIFFLFSFLLERIFPKVFTSNLIQLLAFLL